MNKSDFKTARKILFILFAVLCLLIGLYPFVIYSILQQIFNLLPLKKEVIQNSPVWEIGFNTHIYLGGLALLTGWSQFVTKWQVRKLNIHRQIGKLYVFCALASSLTGVGIGIFATGGIVAALGFCCLGIIWFYSTFMAYSSVRNGNIEKHKLWMIYSYAACFAAVTLRIWLPILTMVFGDFLTAYRVVAWLCWIPNILVAVFIVKKNSVQVKLL